jgi:hypothetical protein
MSEKHENLRGSTQKERKPKKDGERRKKDGTPENAIRKIDG